MSRLRQKKYVDDNFMTVNPTKEQSDAKYAPKAATAPADGALGITAGDFDRLFIDSNNIVRFSPRTA